MGLAGNASFLNSFHQADLIKKTAEINFIGQSASMLVL